jgi:hypothetical protein
MPRPKTRELTVIKSFALEYSLYVELEEMARKNNVSVSSFLERIISTYLNNSNKIDPKFSQCPVHDDDIDPLTALDLQLLQDRIAKYERSIENFSNDKKNMLQWIEQSKDEFTKKHRKEKYDQWYNKTYKNIYGTWFDLRDSFEKLRRKIPKEKAKQMSKKLAELKKKIENLFS